MSDESDEQLGNADMLLVHSRTPILRLDLFDSRLRDDLNQAGSYLDVSCVILIVLVEIKLLVFVESRWIPRDGSGLHDRMPGARTRRDCGSEWPLCGCQQGRKRDAGGLLRSARFREHGRDQRCLDKREIVFPHARPAPFRIQQRCRHAAHVDRLGLAEVDVGKRDAVLLQDAFELLPAGSGKAGCPVELEAMPDIVDQSVIETRRAQFALLDRTYGSVLSLRRVETDRPCGSGLASPAFHCIAAARDGIEIVAVLPCDLDQDSPGVFRRNHLGFQGG